MNREKFNVLIYKTVKSAIMIFLTTGYTVFLQSHLKQQIFEYCHGKVGLFVYGVSNSLIMALLVVVPFFIKLWMQLFWKSLKWLKKMILPIVVHLDYKIVHDVCTDYEYKTDEKIIMFNNEESLKQGFKLQINVKINNVNKRKLNKLINKNSRIIIATVPTDVSFHSLNDIEMDKHLKINVIDGKITCDIFSLYENAKVDKTLEFSFECVSVMFDIDIELQGSTENGPFFFYNGGDKAFKVTTAKPKRSTS